MSNHLKFEKCFTNSINQVKVENRYRVFRDICRTSSPPIAIYTDDKGTQKEIILWCSNDYLSMGKNAEVIKAMQQTLYEYGGGSGGTRNISGNSHKHRQLESELAALHHKESALLFTSGYVANASVIPTIASILQDCVFFSDESNHASIRRGIGYSKNAEKCIWQHNNIDHLESLLQKTDPNKNKIIIFESIYSMEGDRSPIKEICYLANKYNAFTYLDEVHSVGIYGKYGAGIASEQGVLQNIDILQGTLGKTFGLMGGYIAAKASIVDAVRCNAPGFIFTTSLPPAIIAGALESIRQVAKSDNLRSLLQTRAKQTADALKRYNIPYIHHGDHIIYIPVGIASTSKRIADILLEQYDIYIQPVNFPTVKKGNEGLRITPNHNHTAEMIEHLCSSLSYIYKELLDVHKL